MDYSRLRAAALRDGEDEEAVTVDTRALIDKVLARYSGEWTTLRELIQNAADAQATTVKITWETQPSTQVPLPKTTSRSELLKHTITHNTLRRLVVQNNGQPFTKTDWGRLKRIAEGNPDETKIGAFGVGFYSVFADCEEPLVSSGKEAMAFYWKGNALFTRKMQLPPGEGGGETAFVLDYRNTTTPIPNLLSVSQFLATSLTFVALQNIEFWIDDYQILALKKKSSPSVEIAISKTLETRTKEGLMKLSAVERMSTQIDATFMSVLGWKSQTLTAGSNGDMAASDEPGLKGFFYRLTSAHASKASLRAAKAKEEKAAQEAIAEDVTSTSTSSIFLRTTAAAIQTKVTAAFAAELERATKKPPPKVTKLAILTSSFDETEASEQSSTSTHATKAADVFSSVLPSKKPGGRIFIGFPTTQTTGAGMHISAPSVIPTVEREAIDLNARWVRTWNIEMLRVAGTLTRLAFSNEMADFSEKIRRELDPLKTNPQEFQAVVHKYIPEALHILKTYSFTDSTPSGQVGQLIEEAFWTSHKNASVEVYSSRGVLSTTKVRIGSEELSKFVNGIPVILPEMKDSSFVKKIIDFGLVNDITVDDVYKELEAKALDRDQLHHFVAWAAKSATTGELDPPSKQRLLDVAVATVADNGDSADIIALATITNYLNVSKIPASMPIPPTTLPLAFTKDVPFHQLQALGWEALEVVPWLRFLIETTSSSDDEHNLTKSPEFAAKVLAVLSKNWESLSQSSKNSVVHALQNVPAIPTKMGMKKPGESYFPSVKLFDDLPNVQGCQGVKDKFLSALGVRKTIDLETIFTRLLNPAPVTANGDAAPKKWSHMELIRYLTSVRNDIPADDMKKLKQSRLCPAEAGPRGQGSQGTTELYKVSDLFEPKDSLRALNLPILQWSGPTPFRSSSPEARFLYSLGLRPHPSVPELVDMMASSDASLRNNAMTYFIANHHINGYSAFTMAGVNKAILPLEGNDKQLVPPSACYTNEGASVLGYNILKKELHPHAGKFGVARDPPLINCVDKLLSKPPRDTRSAAILFEYFASRIAELGENNLAKLRDGSFVPIFRRRAAGSDEKGSTTLVHARPQHVYLGSSTTYGDIFDFVDFGNTANLFLLKCGAKNEPTKAELAKMACGEPARLLSVLQSPEKYLSLLKSLAVELSILKKDKELFKKMKTSPWLLGSKEISQGRSSDSTEDDEPPIRQYQLATANEIVITDDYIAYRLFKDSLLCAPEDDTLEAFYMALGSQTLGSLVNVDLKVGPRTNRQEGVAWLRKHVLERTKIFLHEYSKYNEDAIKHDVKWLEKNLTLDVVQSVSLRRTLRGHSQSHTEKRSVASARVNSGYILYIAGEGKPDMYQLGQAVCKLVLNRPGQQAYFFFEPFLKLDLLELRSRGYNVDRILRAKAAEARIAEEERRKALDAEQKKIKEREQEWAQMNPSGHVNDHAVAASARDVTKTPNRNRMPGAFDSPEDDRGLAPPAQAHKPKSLWSQLSRNLGFESDDESQKQMDNFHPQQPQQQQHDTGMSKGLTPNQPAPTTVTQPGGRGTRGGNDDGRVTSPAVVQQNLLNAIRSTRAHDSAQLFSPPSQTEVKEQATYCDSTEAKNIVFAAEAPGGMRVFVSRELSVSASELLTANAPQIKSFESVLRDIASIYGLALTSLHIFYDERGGTIAFNSNGSIFCNLRFFNQLHALKVRGGVGQARVEAATWWWVVIAHELAHNLVGTHDADHSYYTESFIQTYFGKMMSKAVDWSANGNRQSMEMGTAGEGDGEGDRPRGAPPSYQSITGQLGYRSLLD
jgi:hypothetical protein